MSQLSQPSTCTAKCGGGTQFRTRKIIKDPSPGGAPCPPLEIEYPCNTYFCRDRMEGRGYFYFGPISGPAKLRYQVSQSCKAHCLIRAPWFVSDVPLVLRSAPTRSQFHCILFRCNEQVAEWGRDRVDVFVFDEENWGYYIEDLDRNVPFNWGYRPVAATLNTENADGVRWLFFCHLLLVHTTCSPRPFAVCACACATCRLSLWRRARSTTS